MKMFKYLHDSNIIAKLCLILPEIQKLKECEEQTFGELGAG